MGIRDRLVASHFALVLIIVLLIGLVSVGLVRGFILRSSESTLRDQAEQVAGLIDARAFFLDQRPTGLTGAPLARLVSLLTSADFLVVNSEGEVLLGSERLVSLAGGQFQPGLVREVLSEGKTSSATFGDPLGRLSVVAAAPVVLKSGRAIGAVILLRPVTEVARTTSRLLVFFVLASLVGLGLSLALSFFLARTLTRPLYDLQKASARVAAGDFDQRIEVRSEDELGQTAASFNAMASRLGELHRERQDLYASVSHELRTPVTSIKGFAQALEDNVGEPEERRRHLAIIQEEATRLERLVSDLFQLSRLEGGQVSLELKTVDLARLAGNAVDRYRSRADTSKVELSFATAGLTGPGDRTGQLPVKGDPDRLNQVLSNLIENALRFTPEGGRIEVRAERAGDAAVVRVADTGPGIPEGDLERVFDRFYTVDRSRARSRGGTGLGLAIAKEIVRAHGGHIRAERRPEGGTLLSFSLPLLSGPTESGGGM